MSLHQTSNIKLCTILFLFIALSHNGFVYSMLWTSRIFRCKEWACHIYWYYQARKTLKELSETARHVPPRKAYKLPNWIDRSRNIIQTMKIRIITSTWSISSLLWCTALVNHVSHLHSSNVAILVIILLCVLSVIVTIFFGIISQISLMQLIILSE